MRDFSGLLQTGLCSAIAVAIIPLSLGATIDDVSPLSGLPGETITLTGTFDPAQVFVHVGGTQVTLASSTAEQLTFVVQQGIVSGEVAVTDGADPVRFPFPLLVRRQISGSFAPPTGISPGGFTVVAGSSESLVAANGTFTTQVTTGKPTTLWIFKAGQPSTFLSAVTDSDPSAFVSAERTALSMVVNNPLTGRRDSVETDALISVLQNTGEFGTLADIISTAALESRDYLEDARFDPPFTCRPAAGV